KPALYRSTLKGVKGERRPTDIRVYANAKEVYVLDMRGKTVSILRRTTDSPTISGFEPFLQKERPQYTLTGRVTETSFHHKPAYSIEVKTDKATASLGSVVIDPVSFLPLGWTYVRGNSEVTIGYQVTLNEPMQEKDFSTTLPKGFRLLVDQRSQPAH
ncbi:MAG TPA: hypothetical protein VG944_18980, partial [Fimbriimonas sp.]|nr:hypothetical protein [Fimbriimonas sp.]